jgi:hypothetical protein
MTLKQKELKNIIFFKNLLKKIQHSTILKQPSIIVAYNKECLMFLNILVKHKIIKTYSFIFLLNFKKKILIYLKNKFFTFEYFQNDFSTKLFSFKKLIILKKTKIIFIFLNKNNMVIDLENIILNKIKNIKILFKINIVKSITNN